MIHAALRDLIYGCAYMPSVTMSAVAMLQMITAHSTLMYALNSFYIVFNSSHNNDDDNDNKKSQSNL